MSQSPEIKLLKGFCSLAFGESRDQVKKTFGEPEEIKELKDDILETSSVVYHYWDLGFSIFFDEHRQSRFCSVEVDNRDTLLAGKKIFSLNEKEITELMKSLGFPLTDTEVHEWGEKRVSFDEACLDCYFENNKLVSLNFSAPESDEDLFFHAN